MKFSQEWNVAKAKVQVELDGDLQYRVARYVTELLTVR